VALIWMVALLGWTGVCLLPDRYVSTARIYADADAVLGLLLRGIAIDNSPAAQVEVLQRTLVSRPNLERVVDRTALSQRIADGIEREKVIQTLGRDLRFGIQGRNLFTVEYVDTDPSVAHDVVQHVVELFLELASGSDRRQMENARSFLVQQLAVYEQQLREAEQRRATFTAAYQDLLSLNGSVSRLDAVRARIEAMRGELSDAISRRDLLRQQIAQAPAASAATSTAEAEQRLMVLRQRYTDQHPEVAAARANLAAARAVGGSSRTAAGGERADQARDQLAVRLVDADAQIASLERQLRELEIQKSRLDEMARNAPEVQAQFANLDRDYNIIRRNYEELLSRREAVNIAEAARTGTDRVTLDVVDPPTLPVTPTGPKRLLLAAGVLLAAFGAAGALLFLQVQLDTSFYSLRELRGVGLTVLGALSGSTRRRVRTADVLLLVLCLLPLPLGLVVATMGPRNIMEMFVA
jgi:polysaccharide chain length determinant protein (PEP-CTERM system associated)